MDSANTVEYKLRDLPTRSVTLFPTRAQVFREIKDVPLKAGDNKITIIGLSPTVDKDSVKVEGSGLAVITDISVTKEDNHEIFEEIYPEHDWANTEIPPPTSNESHYEDSLKQREETVELEEAREKLATLQDESKAADEAVRSATERLTVLDNYSKNLGRNDPKINISDYLATYRIEREKMFRDQQEGERKQRELVNSVEEARIKVMMYEARQNHQRAMAEWEDGQKQLEEKKKRESELRRKNQEQRKKATQKAELLEFWPKYVYNICITLDANPYTPMSSRRNSTTSEVELAKASPTATADGEASTVHCDLMLSYVTTSAFWAPSYDMQLNTTSATGTLLFDAQLHNSTSETWSNCHVTLSTSQATATSIEEPIPALVPWHIRLIGKSQHSKDSTDDITLSKEELKRKNEMLQKINPITSLKDRSEMFKGDPTSNHNLQDYQLQLMLLEQQNKKRLMMARKDNDVKAPSMKMQEVQMPQMQIQQQARLQQQMQQQAQIQQQAQTFSVQPNQMYAQQAQAQMSAQQPPGGMSLFSKRAGPSVGGLFGSSSPAPAPAAAAIPPPPVGSADQRGSGDVLNDFDFDSFLRDGDAETVSEPLPVLDFKDSLIEETGLTTAYDLPGTKTLKPGATSSKHRVARLSLSNIVFSYTIVPKYKPVAFLKAKIRNGSKLTLLRGTLGLTLDGGFMGRTTLPRCSAGETMTLGLGIDPSVRVRYPGPDVRRATTGLFSKEDSSVYSRSITLENTRSSSSSKPCHIFVHDQVPVSEDERLKVEVQVPRGLVVNGSAVRTGKEGAAGEQGKNWGEANAITKDTGSVTWNVRLNPGKAVRLDLEYVVAMPGGGSHSAVSLG